MNEGVKSPAKAFWCVAAFTASGCLGALAGDMDKNTSGLPSYPHLNSSLMVNHDRFRESMYNDYKQDSPDSVDAVIAWYRKRLPGWTSSKTEGDYAGLQFTNGKDIVWVYRFGRMDTTSIEAMKYVGPAPKGD